MIIKGFKSVKREEFNVSFLLLKSNLALTSIVELEFS